MEGFQMISVHTPIALHDVIRALTIPPLGCRASVCTGAIAKQHTGWIAAIYIRDDVFPHISAVHVQPDLRNDLLDGLE